MEKKEKLSTLAQGLKILGSFSESQSIHTISSIAKIHSISRSSARRYLLTLNEEGYLKFDGKKFSLSAKILDYAYNFLSINNINTVITPYLKELTSRTNEPCGVATLDGTEIKYVAWNNYNSVWPFRMNLEIGAKLPAFCTSMGRVLLSLLDDDDLELLFKSINMHPFTKHTQTKLITLKDNISFADKNGFSIMHQELVIGMTSVAVPINNKSSPSSLALNLSLEYEKYSDQHIVNELVPEMKHIASKISEDIKLHKPIN